MLEIIVKIKKDTYISFMMLCMLEFTARQTLPFYEVKDITSADRAFGDPGMAAEKDNESMFA